MLTGQEEQERAFAEAFATGRMPHAWLLAGPKGIGKALFARRAATWLIASDPFPDGEGRAPLDVPPHSGAASQVREGTHPEFLWIKREVPEAKRPRDGGVGRAEDVARSITIAQIRDMLARLRLRPVNSRWRCVVIDSVDDIERGGTNALLKTLEEPPEGTIFLLISHNPARLLPTIRSRCRLLRFAPLDDQQMRVAIAQMAQRPSDDDADVLLRIAAGSPGRFAQLVDGDIAAMRRLLCAIADGGDSDNGLRVQLAQMVSGSGATGRLDQLLAVARQVAADAARRADGSATIRAVDAEARIADIERFAIAQSEDPASVAFVVGSALSMIRAG